MADTQARSGVVERVRQVVVRVGKLPGPAFADDADLYRELGVESVAALDLLWSLEEEFSLAIPDAGFNDARSVRALAALIESLP